MYVGPWKNNRAGIMVEHGFGMYFNYSVGMEVSSQTRRLY
jgi:hypothetical protein